MKKQKKPTLSFIIPLKDEEHTLQELYDRIAEQANEHSRSWEILFIDDGSEDRSWSVIETLARKNPDRIRALKFRTNRTKAPALATGYKEANGEIIFTLDADLQDDPKEIPRFLAKLGEGDGWDIVSGYKEKRHDPWHKVLPSRIFNKMLSKVNGVKLHDHNCGFKCYRREVVQNLPMYGEMHRMVPSLASIEGFKTTEIVVEHHARKHGVSKYGWERLIRGFLDMWSVFFVKTFRERPLHFFGSIAVFLGMLACLFWLLGFLPFMPSVLKSAFLAAAPASLFAAPVCLAIGFLAELISYRYYKDGTDVPIIERIDIQQEHSGENVVSFANAKADVESPRKPKILVADDDGIVRSISQRILETEGWDVSIAETGEEAMMAVTPEIDVILLDIYLPGLSGLEVLPKIKQLSPSTQVVVLSGSEKPADGASAIKAGGFDFLSKPIEKETLLAVLNRALKASQSLRPQSVKMG